MNTATTEPLNGAADLSKIPETQPSAIVAELAATMPTPTAPATTTQAPTPSPKPEAAKRHAPDSNGKEFDPAKHKVDAQGNPRRDAIGRFISTRQGGNHATAAKPAQQASFIPDDTPAAPAPAPTAPQTAPTVEADGSGMMDRGAVADKYALLADVYTRAALAGMMAALGDEWQPDDDAEYCGLRDSVAAYLRATQQEELSPGWALAFAVATYGGKRIPRPKTQTRIAGFIGALKAWWQGRRVSRVVNSYPHPEGS